MDLDAWIDRDLSADARMGALAPAYEMGDRIEQAEEVLRAQGQRSVVFVGPPGVGKTALVHELLRRAHAGMGVDLLARCRVVQISLRAIGARFKERSDATNFFGDLCNALLHAVDPPVLPFIRDVHLAFQLDWEPTLHRFLMQLPRPILAEALPREFEQLTEYWTDLGEHLVPIPVEEPTIAQVRSIVSRWSTWHGAQRGRAITPEAQRIAIELTARFMGDKTYPRKVLDLLGQTMDFHREDLFGGGSPVGVPEVVHRFSQMTRVPSRLVDPDEPLNLSEVRDFVGRRLLGQDEAVDAVLRMIAKIKAGLADLRRPFGVFLFVGPTGVGKTHTAHLLAEYLFGDRDRIITINMAEYSNEGQAQLLFGNPYAPQVKDQRGLLTARLQGHPFGVLLLDEFEKAHDKIHDGFLQLVDEGRFVNGRSETVSVTSLIVIATSNAGSEVYRQSGLGFDLGRDPKDLDRELDRRLDRVFRFEFLNRFDRIVHFHPLSRTDIRDIARRELEELSRRDGLVSRDLHVDVEDEVLDWLVAHGYHPHYGARFLRREIERSVVAVLAEFIVREHPRRGARVALGVYHDRIEARKLPEVGPSPLRVPQGDQVARPTWTHDHLRAEAQRWLRRWAALERESDARREASGKLVEESARSGFWDDAARSKEALKQYTALDARLQSDRRLLKPVHQLARAIAGGRASDALLATLVDQVALNYRRWIDLGAADEADAAWLVLSSAGPEGDCARWMVDLVAMYRPWLRRKHCAADVEAEEVRDDGALARVILAVHGPGAFALLGMEVGEHARRTRTGRVDRAIVEVIPRREQEGGADLPHARIEDVRPVRGVVVPRRVARLGLDLPTRGMTLTLLGSSRDTLRDLARDLGAAMATTPHAPSLARSYGDAGAVRDPRTGASTTRLHDVLRGDLEIFLRAWEVR